MPEGNVLQSLTANGASVNAFTGSCMTAYHFECAEHFYTNLRILLSFVTTPYFTAESVAKEQGIIAQEIRMVADRPGWRVYNNLLQSLYCAHPLRTPIPGSEESIARITPSVLKQCHKAFYSPENMILCVVGDVDPERVIATARMVVPAAKGTAAQRALPEEPASVARERISTAMPIASTTFLTGFKATRVAADPLRQALVGDLAGDLLCGDSSLLYQRLYREGLIDHGFGVTFEQQPQAAFLVLGGDSPDPDRVAQAVLEEGQRLCRDGIPSGDFRRTLRSCYGSRVGALDSFEHTCVQLARSHFQGCDYYSFPERYEKITVEEVLGFLRDTVTSAQMATSVLTPLER
jgi:predicted Zn-dependent peptidase